MAKYTLLQLVQQALSVIDAMNVQSVSETEESEQVVLIANRIYNELLDDYPWDHLRTVSNLEVTSTAHQMKIPDSVSSIDWIRYNNKDVTYITPYEMVKLLGSRDTTLSNVDSAGAYDDKDPQYWTSNDDEYVLFDSYNQNLTASSSDIGVVVQPSALSSGTDVADLPEILHGVLLNRIIADAFTTLKGDPSTGNIYEMKAIRGLAKAKRWARRYSEKRSTFNNGYGWNSRSAAGMREIPT